MEQPWSSRALKLPIVEGRKEACRARVCQRMYGFTVLESGLLNRKRTALDVNDSGMAQGLQEGSQCCHRPEQHEKIEGTTRLDGKSVGLSKVVALWTPAFAKKLLNEAEKVLTKRKELSESWSSLESETLEVGEPVPEEFWDVEDNHIDTLARRHMRELQVEDEERRGELGASAGRDAYVHFKGAGLEVNKQTRNTLAKLHVNLGQASNERLACMLLLNGADKAVVEACKSMKCMVCERLQRPQSDPQISPANRGNSMSRCSWTHSTYGRRMEHVGPLRTSSAASRPTTPATSWSTHPDSLRQTSCPTNG